MKPRPTGRLARTPQGVDVVLAREFPDSPAAVWRDLTESQRTARWFGPWEGEARVGSIIAVRLVFEDGEPTSELRIDACEPERRLAVTMLDDYGEWRLDLLIEPPATTGSPTRLTLVQHVDPGLDDVADMIASVGPGWEYYLDMFGAARSGVTLPDFDDYYPALSAHYTAQVAALTSVSPRRRP